MRNNVLAVHYGNEKEGCVCVCVFAFSTLNIVAKNFNDDIFKSIRGKGRIMKISL